jgi:hypothetical protein
MIFRRLACALLLFGCHAAAAPAPPPRAPLPVVEVESAPLAEPQAPRPTPEEEARIRAVCEQYRRALEARDVDALLALASPSYLDDGGTAAPQDDLAYDDLDEHLAGLLGSVEEVRYELRITRIDASGPRVVVELSYAATFVMGEKQRQRVDDGRLVLEPHGSSYRILSGM